MNNSSNISLSNTNELTQNWLLELMPKLLIDKDKERIKASMLN